MKKKSLFLSFILVLSVILTACGGADTGEGNGNGEGEESKGTLTFGINNWAENIAVSNMWKILLAEKGYEVELTELEKAAVWQGIENGDLDIAPEVWLPITDEPLYEKYKDGVVLGDIWYEGTALGLAVPTYMEDLNSIEQLNDFSEDLGGEIFGIDAGSSLMGLAAVAVEDYGLDLELIASSGPAMMTELDGAYKAEEPIVVTLWSPHWAFAEYDLKYLKDPNKVFGEKDDIYYMHRKGFEEDHPEIVEIFNNWKMDDASLGSLMAMINESSPEEGAAQWIEENRDLVDSWLAAGE